MKKGFLTVLILIAAGALFTSCEKQGAKLYEAKVLILYPDGYEAEQAVGLSVTVQNMITGVTETALTAGNGTAIFFLEEGTYTISSSKETDEFYFNGISENVIIKPEINYLGVNLIASSKKNGLVFKEIYYTGSKTPLGTTYYADQFHEIFNNSDEVVYLDGLCIGCLEPTSSTPSAWVNPDGSIMDRLPVTFHALMFPGTGTTYPLQPRTSVVLAQDGIDHQTDPLGNPTSPVNLGAAPFETYIEPAGKDTDAPGSTNMIVMYTTSTTMFDWLHSVFGAAVIIFRLPTGLDHQTFTANPDNFMTKPGSTSATKYFMVHKDWVIDAVEIVRVEEDKRFKRLPVSLDAGMVWSSGTYTSKSIVRKSRVLDGKLIYTDTNNSSNDFISEWTPTPFILPN